MFDKLVPVTVPLVVPRTRPVERAQEVPAVCVSTPQGALAFGGTHCSDVYSVFGSGWPYSVSTFTQTPRSQLRPDCATCRANARQ